MKNKNIVYLLLILCVYTLAAQSPQPDPYDPYGENYQEEQIQSFADEQAENAEPLAASIDSNLAVLFVAATSLGWYVVKRRKRSI